jgi:gamma-aminobutyric acid type B receptor
LIGNLKYVGYVFFAMVGVSVIACVGWTLKYRTSVVIRAAQPFFLIMVASGVLIMASSLVPLSFDDGGDLEPESHTWSVGVCMSVPWLAFTGFTVAFSALFSKTWRVNRLFKAKAGHTRIKLSAGDVLAPFAFLLGCNILVLTLWTVLDPLEYKRQDNDGTDYWNRVISTYGACRSDNAVAYLVPLAFINFSVIVTACWQALEAKDIQSEFAETKYIGLAVASAFQAFLTGIPVVVVVMDIPQAYYLMLSIMIFLLSMVLLFVDAGLARARGCTIQR